MMERREGRIVTISSTGAYGGRVNGAIYGAAKAAAVHYTRCLAAQLRPFNVTANSIAPGGTRTARFLATREVDPRRLIESGTLERVALVDEVARAVAVFVGPTGDFITGQVLRVDGGGQLWPA
jgi:3-oxoacyl-[acyl-carrier protein] reductase